MDTSSTSAWAFYYLQAEDGEDRSHPNAFRIPKASPGADITLADVHKHFPLANPHAFHFRFRINSAKGDTFFWIDITSPSQVVPLVNGRVISKVLRLQRPVKVGLVLHRKPVLKWIDSLPSKPTSSLSSVQPISSQRSNTNSSIDRPQKYSDASSSPGPPARPPPTATAPSSSKPSTESTESFEDFLSGGGAPSKPAPDVVDLMGSGPVSLAEMEKHKVSSDGTQVYNPDLVDKSTKSSAVRAAMEERERTKAAEIERARQDLLRRDDEKAAMDNAKAHSVTVLGPKMKAWAEDNGRKKNIRTLLSTMHHVNMGKLLMPNDVKKVYRRAIMVVHPDKAGGRTPDQLVVAERIFDALNTAWDDNKHNMGVADRTFARVEKLLTDYVAKDLDFGLDSHALSLLLDGDKEWSDEIVKAFASPNGLINALTFITGAALAVMGEPTEKAACKHPLYFTILFMCALRGFVLITGQGTIPKDDKLEATALDVYRTDNYSKLTKDEFTKWTTSKLSSIAPSDLTPHRFLHALGLGSDPIVPSSTVDNQDGGTTLDGIMSNAAPAVSFEKSA
ncbi:hypothetical protein DYB28_003067 [Aphanomyces astaci]|uniref:DIX domain-containing protein n=1 Tax=Aphanomyces astaci TaxID=112090 RepID=A0A9X8HE70_APHAT|nr:hypothetical protein DYB28_003067 [Aphanomyces astaci]